jgi:glycosyltransferase involved in cell wall biosynthesis
MINFKIVVPAYNCQEWINKTISSIRNQSYKNFECLLIDDISNDNTYQQMKIHSSGDTRFSCIMNTEKKFALKNFIDGFELISQKPDDVLVVVDGDDWLANEKVLQKVADCYNNTNCLMTYGSFVEFPSGLTHPYYLRAYDSYVVNNSLFRNVPWKASHLRTFKNKLWQNISPHDLIDPETNKHYEVACDLATMFPMLEMAGERSEHIADILYVYNKENQLSDMYIKEQQQLKVANSIRNKNKYNRLNL